FLNPFKRSPPTGPCLDDLLKGGEVKMSAGLYCLESLFGVDRHQFPKTLPCSRRGRQVFYDLPAVINCMLSLLDGSTPGRRWLPEVVLRKRVLTGIIQRVRDVCPDPKLADILNETLQPYLS